MADNKDPQKAAQEEMQVKTVVDDWTKVLVETKPMNRTEAEKAVLELYTASGMKRPMEARMPTERDAGPEVIYCTSVGDYTKKAQAFAAKIKKTDAAAREFNKDKALGTASTPWSDGDWLAADDYHCRYVAKPGDDPRAHPIQFLKAFARNAFGLATFSKVAFIIERPIKIVQREENGGLQWHNTEGPVLEWPDGEKLYAIEGFFVDEQLVMRPSEQTMEQIHEEKNLEIRRIRIERYGWEQYLKASEAKVIDKRRNDIDGGCFEALCSVPGLKARVLLCTCPTGRVFNLLVPEATKTCQEAKDYLKGNPNLNDIGRT